MRKILLAAAVLGVFVSSGVCGKTNEPSAEVRNAAHQAICDGNAATLKALLDEGLDPNVRLNEGRSMLAAAALMGRAECVRVLLAAGADVNAPCADGKTAMHGVCGGLRKMDVIRALLAAGANVNAQDYEGCTPLHRAVKYGPRRTQDEAGREIIRLWGQEAVEALLEAKADPRVANAAGETPLHWAAFHGAVETVTTLLKAGADVNAKDKTGKTPLVWAIHGDVSPAFLLAVEALLDAKADPEAAGTDGEAPLHLASQIDAAPIAERLLKAGADLNAVDAQGRTAVWWAAANGCPNTLALLLEKKADVARTDAEGKTPLVVAAEHGWPASAKALRDAGAKEASWTPLQWAAILGDAEGARTLLATKVDVNARDRYGYTALIYAAARGDAKMVGDLAAAGADAAAAATDGETALLAVCRSDNTVATARVLLGAKAPINAQNAEGYAPLHRAIVNRDVDLTRALLAAQADPNLRTARGEGALHLAAAAIVSDNEKAETIVTMLLDAQADPMAYDEDGKRPINRASFPFGPAYRRLQSETLKAEDATIDRLLEAAARETEAPGPAKTPQEVLRQYGRAMYRQDLEALRACYTRDNANDALLPAILEYQKQSLAFRQAMIAAYGRERWQAWGDHDGPKAAFVFPLVTEDLIQATRILISGDTAACDAFQMHETLGRLRFVREDGAWRIDVAGLLSAGADRDKIVRRLTETTAAIAALRPEIGKPGVTAQRLNWRLGKTFDELTDLQHGTAKPGE